MNESVKVHLRSAQQIGSENPSERNCSRQKLKLMSEWVKIYICDLFIVLIT